MMIDIRQRLANIGFDLPSPAKPVADYAPYHRVGSLLFVSGQLSSENGHIVQGFLGADLTIKDGQAAARLAALNALAWLDRACCEEGCIPASCAQISGYIASVSHCTDQARVMDHASQVMATVFGPGHSRLAVGVAVLPLKAAVEIASIFVLEDNPG